MSFKFIRTTIRRNGTAEVLTEVIERDTIVLGRGSGCEVILKSDSHSSSSFSLTHAKLTANFSAGSLTVEDLDSLTGVRVNRKLVKRSTLKSGDVLAIGPLEFTIGRDNLDFTLSSTTEEKEKSDDDAVIAEKARRFSAQSSLPSMRVLSWIVILAVAGFAGAVPFITNQRIAWSAGEVTNKHKPIEADCASCHEGNFSKVSDTACQKCHSMTEHGDTPLALAKVTGEYEHSTDANLVRTDVIRSKTSQEKIKKVHHTGLTEQTCVSCHQEHNGPHALVATDSRQCTDCHAQIKNTAPDTALLNVADWETHPAFFGGNAPSDPSHIKLNHKVHLQPDIRGANGPVTMQCADCHQLSDDRRSMKPISRKEHCASCHSMGFDERLPNVEVPHAPPDVVYQFLYAQYAQLLLKDSEPAKVATRTKPGAKELPADDAREFAHAEVEKFARIAERDLFTRTACKLCHEISEADVVLPSISSSAGLNSNAAQQTPRSYFRVVAPEIPSVWMPKAIFNHGAHDNVTCQSCHGEVQKSELTSDAHLPKIEGCKDCHADVATTGKVASDCTQCHGYHESTELPATSKRDVTDLLSYVKGYK